MAFRPPRAHAGARADERHQHHAAGRRDAGAGGDLHHHRAAAGQLDPARPAPDRAAGPSDAPKFVTLVVDKTGQAFLNDKPVTQAELARQPGRRRPRRNPDTEVQLRADQARAVWPGGRGDGRGAAGGPEPHRLRRRAAQARAKVSAAPRVRLQRLKSSIRAAAAPCLRPHRCDRFPFPCKKNTTISTSNERRKPTGPRRDAYRVTEDARARRSSTPARCCPTPAASCTWAMCATTPSTTCSRATCA